MAESIKISELDELVSGSVLGTTKVPVVDGGATKYAQASSIKAFVNSDVATDAELASQIASVNSTIDGLTTADISENASYLYYTDVRVTDRLNALSVLSGSSTSLTVTNGGDVTVTAVDNITFIGATVANDVGPGDVIVTIESTPTLTVGNGEGIPVSNVDNITFTGATIVDNSNGDIEVTISGGTSTDISALNTFTGSIRNEINGIEAFTASFSSSVESRIVTLEGAGGSSTPDGTISGSQQITDFGFLSSSIGLISSSEQVDYNNIQNAPNVLPTPTFLEGTNITITSASLNNTITINSSGGGLSTEANYFVISQSVITGDPIDSNLLLSSVYIDKTRTIKFSQFSQSLDARIAAGGGVGSTDYISNVTFGNNMLTFTGVGSAFSDSVALPNGLVSSSGQIFEFGYLRDIDLTTEYIATTLPNGIVSSSAQLSDIADGFVSSSAQIVLLNTVSGGFDTSHIEENPNFQYYTDTKVQGVIDGLGVISGSLLPSGSVSSSSQIDYQLIYNKLEFYTGSTNLIITSGSPDNPEGYGNPWVSFEVLAPSNTDFSTLITDISDNLLNKNLISGSSQISDLGFTDIGPLNDWTGSTGGFGAYSSSVAIRIDSLSNSAITSSEQIDYEFLQNVPTFSPGDGILISQSLENEITITSNASAPTWDSVTFKPFDIVSSSQQIEDYYTFALTGSDGVGGNIFYGDQIITGSILSNGEIIGSGLTIDNTATFNGAATFVEAATFNDVVIDGNSSFSGRVYNTVDGFISSPPAGTASLDFSTRNFFQIQLDDTSITHISASNVVAGQVVNVLLQCGTNSTASFSSNILQPIDSFYEASQIGQFDMITFTTFDSGVYLTSVKNNFV
jgi:hypothetical protein